jgi:hypothetical protein
MGTGSVEASEMGEVRHMFHPAGNECKAVRDDWHVHKRHAGYQV